MDKLHTSDKNREYYRFEIIKIKDMYTDQLKKPKIIK